MTLSTGACSAQSADLVVLALTLDDYRSSSLYFWRGALQVFVHLNQSSFGLMLHVFALRSIH